MLARPTRARLAMTLLVGLGTCSSPADEPRRAGDPRPGGDTASGDTSPASDSDGPGSKTCQERCETEFDCWGCTASGAPVPVEVSCVAGRCAIEECQTADPCVTVFSLWSIHPCASNADCDAGVCVAVWDGGYCAVEPTVDGCSTPYGDERDWREEVRSYRDSSDGDSVVVCAYATVCHEGMCEKARRFDCLSDDDCQPSGRCHSESGLCVQCLEDADCVPGPLTSCSAAGRCVCATDNECQNAGLGAHCIDGRCTCSVASDCSARACEETTLVCEP